VKLLWSCSLTLNFSLCRIFQCAVRYDNVIYLEVARHRDAALDGNHTKMKCILYYLHNEYRYNIENVLESTFQYGELEYIVII